MTTFDQNLTALNTALSNFANKIAKAGSFTAVNTTQDIAAGQTVQYDLNGILAANLALYDVSLAEVHVFVLDASVGNPTSGSYINSEAVAVVGVNNNRYVTITNNYETVLNFHIIVTGPRKQ